MQHHVPIKGLTKYRGLFKTSLLGVGCLFKNGDLGIKYIFQSWFALIVVLFKVNEMRWSYIFCLALQSSLASMNLGDKISK